MVTFDFQLDRVVLTRAALGGVINAACSYKDFPTLATVPPAELEKLGDALMLLAANLEAKVSQIGLQAAVVLVKEGQGPAIVVPDKTLVVP